MPTINQLPVLNTISSGDQLPVYSPNNGDARRTSIGSLLTFFQQSFASPTVSTNLYTPGTGFNITAPTPVSEQQWMLLQPAGTLASGTITLPLNTGVPDGTQVLITSTQTITSFTLALNGAAAGFGFPSSLEAGAGFTVRYYQATNSWYNINADLSVNFTSLTVTPGLTTLQGLVVGRGSGVNTSNVVMGDGLTANTTGTNNVAINNSALLVNTTGLKNIAIGTNTLKANIDGFSNIAIGFDSQQARTTARQNVSIGDSTLRLNVSGLFNTAIGGSALATTTGSTNTCVGYLSGFQITTGSNNVILGNFQGNSAALDIRTATTGYVVLSNGNGDVVAYWNGANATFDGDLTLTGTLFGNDIELSGPLTAAGNVLVNSSSGKIGYATGNGAGGTVTQATSRTTAVVLNKPTGAITLFSAAGTTVATTFTVTNSTVLATSVILLNQKSGTDLYDLMVTAVAAGSFNITFRTTGGTTTETPVFSFAVISGSIA